ncbi:MAG: FAD-binding protein [Bilophila wadsworthia]
MNTSTHPLGTLIETDVLVIGSGASGCGAALEGARAGVARPPHGQGQVGKLRLHRRRNDHYMAVLDEEGVAHDAAEDLIKFYAKPLNGWTPAMLRNGWYAHMRPMLEKLEAAGVEFGRTPDGRYHRTQGFGQPGTWWVHIANGMTIKRVMARIVRESGVDVLDRVMAVKILTDGGKACGALGWNVSTGEFHIRAEDGCVGAGRLSARHRQPTHNLTTWMYPHNTSAGVVPVTTPGQP